MGGVHSLVRHQAYNFADIPFTDFDTGALLCAARRAVSRPAETSQCPRRRVVSLRVTRSTSAGPVDQTKPRADSFSDVFGSSFGLGGSLGGNSLGMSLGKSQRGTASSAAAAASAAAPGFQRFGTSPPDQDYVFEDDVLDADVRVARAGACVRVGGSGACASHVRHYRVLTTVALPITPPTGFLLRFCGHDVPGRATDCGRCCAAVQ